MRYSQIQRRNRALHTANLSRMKRFITFFAALILASTAFAESAAPTVSLTPHRAEYKVKVSVLSGKLETEVHKTELGYEAKSMLRAAGMARMFVRGDVREESSFEVFEGGVRPLTYNSSDKISKEDKFMDFRFDWEAAEVTGTVNDQEIAFPLDGQVHDRVSVQYELMLDLLNNRESAEYALLDDDELKVLAISKLGEKEVKVPYGKFEAIGIQHRKKKIGSKKVSSRVTTLWLVEELDYLPVLIEQHRDGKLAMRAVLTNYTPFEEPQQVVQSD